MSSIHPIFVLVIHIVWTLLGLGLAILPVCLLKQLLKENFTFSRVVACVRSLKDGWILQMVNREAAVTWSQSGEEKLPADLSLLNWVSPHAKDLFLQQDDSKSQPCLSLYGQWPEHVKACLVGGMRKPFTKMKKFAGIMLFLITLTMCSYGIGFCILSIVAGGGGSLVFSRSYFGTDAIDIFTHSGNGTQWSPTLLIPYSPMSHATGRLAIISANSGLFGHLLFLAFVWDRCPQQIVKETPPTKSLTCITFAVIFICIVFGLQTLPTGVPAVVSELLGTLPTYFACTAIIRDWLAGIYEHFEKVANVNTSGHPRPPQDFDLQQLQAALADMQECKSIVSTFGTYHMICGVLTLMLGTVSSYSAVHTGDLLFAARNVLSMMAPIPGPLLALLYEIANFNSKMRALGEKTHNPQVFMVIAQKRTDIPVCNVVFTWTWFLSLALSTAVATITPFIKKHIIEIEELMNDM